VSSFYRAYLVIVVFVLCSVACTDRAQSQCCSNTTSTAGDVSACSPHTTYPLELMGVYLGQTTAPVHTISVNQITSQTINYRVCDNFHQNRTWCCGNKDEAAPAEMNCEFNYSYQPTGSWTVNVNWTGSVNGSINAGADLVAADLGITLGGGSAIGLSWSYTSNNLVTVSTSCPGSGTVVKPCHIYSGLLFRTVNTISSAYEFRGSHTCIYGVRVPDCANPGSTFLKPLYSVECTQLERIVSGSLENVTGHTCMLSNQRGECAK
jgi:hypothetical protein